MYCTKKRKVFIPPPRNNREEMGQFHLRGKWRTRTPRWYNAALTHAKWMGNPSSPTLSSNRQLAKLLSGNEVRGKVAIAAMQKAVNFHSFAIDMVSKSFLSTISSRFGDVLTLTIYLQIFCEFKTHFFFRGRRPIFSTGNVDGVAWLVLVGSFIAYLKLWASFFLN